MTVREVAALYAGLGDDGAIAPLRLVAGALGERRSFVEPDAARAVADVLTQPFPDRGPSGVAWKTGTSWGGRDAWAIGFDAAGTNQIDHLAPELRRIRSACLGHGIHLLQKQGVSTKTGQLQLHGETVRVP